MNTHEQPKLEQEDNLELIKILDYQKELGENIQNWIINNQELPEDFLNKFSSIESNVTLSELLSKIRKELFDRYGEKRNKAQSFKDSRFTPLSEMMERGIISCGVLTSIFGVVLRNAGIPVKFVHGKLARQKGKEHRHAWLEVYNPLKNGWFEIDPTRGNFEMASDTERIKVYHDWKELEDDYNKGNY